MKAAIFDVDGTLVDSVDLHTKAWQATFLKFGHNVNYCKIRSQIGKGGDQLMPVFLSSDEIEKKGKEIEDFRSALFKKEYLPSVKAFPRVRELFERLIEDGWKLALASSAKGEELESYKKIAQIDDLLDAQTTSDDAEKSKPHPDIFQAALTRLKFSPSNCLVIGDSPYDAEAAGKAGISTVGVLSGGFSREELLQAGAKFLYNDLEHILLNYDFSPFAGTHSYTL